MSKVKKMHALAKEIRQEGESYNEAVSRASQMMKDQEATQQEMGLGDVVETITEATGIKAVVDWFSDATGIDCGCEARKEKLNELFKTKRNKPQCWDESDYNSFKAFLSEFDGRNISTPHQKSIARLYAKTFGFKLYYPCPTCPSSGPVFKKWIEELEVVYNTYENE